MGFTKVTWKKVEINKERDISTLKNSVNNHMSMWSVSLHPYLI